MYSTEPGSGVIHPLIQPSNGVAPGSGVGVAGSVGTGVGVLSSIGVALGVGLGARGVGVGCAGAGVGAGVGRIVTTGIAVGVGDWVAAGRAQPTNAINASSVRISRANTA